MDVLYYLFFLKDTDGKFKICDDATDKSPHLPSPQKQFTRDDVISFRIAKLAKEGQDRESLFQAVVRQDVDTVRALLSARVTPNFQSQNGKGPVHEAARNGNKDLLIDLRAHQADLWTLSKQGNTALEYAVIEGKSPAVAYLLSSADDDIIAKSRGHEAVVEILKNDRRTKEQSQLSIANQAKIKDFYSAVESNDIIIVKMLLGDGISAGRALAKAIELNNAPMTDLLLSSMEAGHDYDLERAIDVACEHYSLDVLQAVIKKHPRRNQAIQHAIIRKIELHREYIFLAMGFSYKADPELLLEKASLYKNFNAVRDLIRSAKEGQISKEAMNTALNCACTPKSEYMSDEHCVPVAEYLLEKGADPNAPLDLWGNNLQRAAVNGHHRLLDLLIQNGGDVNAIGGFGGRTPLMAAVCSRRWITVSFLLKRGAKITVKERGLVGNILQTACYFGPVQIVEELLNTGLDIDERVEPHGSPLLLALQGLHQDIAELLISKGADLHVSCPNHGTALHYAAMLGMEKMVKLLVEAGADVNAPGGKYGSALQAAVAKGHSIIALYLLDQGPT